MSKSVIVGVVLFVVGIMVGRLSVLQAQPSSSSSTPTPLTPVAAPAESARPVEAQPGGSLRGKVAEVIQVPQYSYLRLESGEWAAVASVPSLTVGQNVVVLLENEMRDFSSPSLGRTFARIWFGVLEGAPPPAARPSVPKPMSAPPPQEVKAALQAVESSGALTLRVVDVYSERALLGGRRVKVKGTVDRVNVVQGVHYLHLKDGTGAAAEKTDDLLCISSNEVPKGTQVVMEGVVALDKNVGMGPIPVVLDSAVAHETGH